MQFFHIRFQVIIYKSKISLQNIKILLLLISNEFFIY